MSLEIFRSSKGKQGQIFFKSDRNKPCQHGTLLKTSPYNKLFTVTVGSNVFQLEKYKYDLAKPYSQILFYLCILLHSGKGQSSSGRINLSPKKSELPSTKEGDDFLFDEFLNFYRNLETIDLSIPPSNCSVVSSSDTPTTAQHMVYQKPLRDTNEELLGVSSEDFPTIFNSRKSEPSKSAGGGGSAEIEDVKSLTYAEQLKNFSGIFKSYKSVEICVRRRRIWEDSVQKLKRLFKDGIKPFHIHFVGKEAVDHGGPFKEYLTLLFDEVKHQLLCAGGNLAFTFLHGIQKLQNGEIYLFGLLCCVGFCTGPRCFLLPHGCSPLNLLHIFRTPFSKNTSGGLLLYIYIHIANPANLLN